VSYHAHTLAEWTAMVCLATSGYGVLSVPYFLLVDANLADFDPRPVLARLDALLIAAANAKTDARTAAAKARHIPRDAALSLAALLLLLSGPTGDLS
jgi:hypothetical protein